MGSLIELVLVLGATAILTVIGIQQDVAKHRSQVLGVEGQNEAVIVKALGSWVDDNFGMLLAQYQQSGNPVLTAPTLDQLHAAGNLKQAYSAGPFWGGDYVIQLAMVPENCSADAGTCHVSYVFYPSQPYTRNGVVDVSGASQIAMAGSASGAQFGYSSTRNPGTVFGINGAWQATNPLPGTPAAAIVATNGPDLDDGNALYIRRDGSLTWTGSQNVNGVDLHNVGSIDAQGTIAALAVAASNVSVSNAVLTPGTLQIQNAAGSAPAPVSMGSATITGNATATGTVQAGSIAVPRSACSGTGIAGDYDGSGLMLSCQYTAGVGFIWLPIGGTTLRYAYYNVANGSVVPAPWCAAGGIPAILLDGQGLYTDPTATINLGTQGAGPWTVTITNGSGAGVQGWAVATTYCEF